MDHEYAFHFKLPKKGLALQMVAIVEGTPEVHFIASPRVPTITEEDFATVCKLVGEGKRPAFSFCPFPKGHPFSGRQYKHYQPAWLRGTSIGDLMSEADWKMKCLHIGVRSNNSKSKFYSWKRSSELHGLATWPDFPKDAKPVGQSVIMSCDLVKVYKEENSMEFVEEPVITITDQSNSSYSKYISKIFPNIAYHDEPLFLKMQELSKLILACEWLKEKGVAFNQEWMLQHTTKSVLSIDNQGTCPVESKRPPQDMIPMATTVQRPSSDVTIITRESEQYRFLSESGVRSYYGYCDGGELLLCTEEGELIQRQHCMKMVFEQRTTIDGIKVGETKKWLNFPFPKLTTLELSMTNQEIQEEFDKYLVPESVREVLSPLGLMTVCVKTDKMITNKGIQLTTTKTAQPHSSKSHSIQETLTIAASLKDYDMLYANYADPNTPIRPNVVPNVKSWSELHHESVPWPKVFQVPYTGVGEPTPSGGVHMDELHAVGTSNERDNHQRESCYAQKKNTLVVQGSTLGTIRHVSKEDPVFTTAASQFRDDWDPKKGTYPEIDFVFVVKNNERERKWKAYRQKLSEKSHENYYRGTTLQCEILTNGKKLCDQQWCGACGISSRGFDLNFNKQKVRSFQRFGPGFYLAPHSSKCHDYTTENHYSGYRAMLRCRVLPGKKYRVTKTNTHLDGPPCGYDSIYGEAGEDLNYPEIVLPKTSADAVIVDYIIIYRKDRSKKLV